MNKITKIIISIISIVVIIVLIMFFTKKNKKIKLEEYAKINYNYFAVYSDDDKVGVIDKERK